MTNSITAIADEIYEELDRDSSLSVTSIAFWLQSNIGKLNTKTYSGYVLQDDLTVLPAIGTKEKDIFKLMYKIHFYDKRIQSTVSASSVGTVLEVQSDGAKVRKVNKIELGKTLLSIRKDLMEELSNCLQFYVMGRSVPDAVHGDDTETPFDTASNDPSRD